MLIKWQDIVAAIGLWGVLFTVLDRFPLPSFYLVASLLAPILGLIVTAQARLAKRERFSVLARDKGAGVGEELIPYLDASREYILLCHFSGERPSDRYINSLKMAYLRDVKVSRLVSTRWEEITQHSATEWLEEHILEGFAEHKYIPVGAEAGTWEIYVFDGESAALALPSVDPVSEGSLPNALVSDDPTFARSLESLFLSYWKRGGPLFDEKSNGA